MPTLKLSIPPYAKSPLIFTETGIKVYSFEELLFHAYNYWKETLTDLESGKVTQWVKDSLALPFLASKINGILSTDDAVSKKYIDFLALENYHDKEDLSILEFQIMAWENKSELEKLKQQGNDRLVASDYKNAIYYYGKLLKYNDDAALYNNIACCYMKLGDFASAETNIKRAIALDNRNVKIKLNYATLYLLQNKSEAATELLFSLEKTDNDRFVQYYIGNMEMKKGNIDAAISRYETSEKMGNTVDANVALCRAMLLKGDVSAASEYAKKTGGEASLPYLKSMAHITYNEGNKKDALKYAEKAASLSADTRYMAYYARILREVNELDTADTVIQKVLDINDKSDDAMFQRALLYKEKGKMKEYENALKSIIEKWKKDSAV